MWNKFDIWHHTNFFDRSARLIWESNFDFIQVVYYDTASLWQHCVIHLPSPTTFQSRHLLRLKLLFSFANWKIFCLLPQIARLLRHLAGPFFASEFKSVILVKIQLEDHVHQIQKKKLRLLRSTSCFKMNFFITTGVPPACSGWLRQWVEECLSVDIYSNTSSINRLVAREFASGLPRCYLAIKGVREQFVGLE